MSDRGRIHAVKHGAFAKTAILPGEDPREFEKLHSALIEEWSPVGPTEEDAVLSIAKGVWRKRRLQKFLHTEIEMCRYNPEHPLYDKARGLRTVLNTMETELDLMERRPDLFEKVIKLAFMLAPSSVATTFERICPREQFESVSDWFAMLRLVASSLLRDLERSGENPDLLLQRSAKVHTPDVVDHELAVDERIDAMIDRAVKRLVQTKAMKQMLVSTSPRGGDDQPPKKNLRDQEELSTINTARTDSARASAGEAIEDRGGRRSCAKGRSLTPWHSAAGPATGSWWGHARLPIATRLFADHDTIVVVKGYISLKRIDLIRLSMALGSACGREARDRLKQNSRLYYQHIHVLIVYHAKWEQDSRVYTDA